MENALHVENTNQNGHEGLIGHVAAKNALIDFTKKNRVYNLGRQPENRHSNEIIILVKCVEKNLALYPNMMGKNMGNQKN